MDPSWLPVVLPLLPLSCCQGWTSSSWMPDTVPVGWWLRSTGYGRLWVFPATIKLFLSPLIEFVSFAMVGICDFLLIILLIKSDGIADLQVFCRRKKQLVWAKYGWSFMYLLKLFWIYLCIATPSAVAIHCCGDCGLNKSDRCWKAWCDLVSTESLL